MLHTQYSSRNLHSLALSVKLSEQIEARWNGSSARQAPLRLHGPGGLKKLIGGASVLLIEV